MTTNKTLTVFNEFGVECQKIILSKDPSEMTEEEFNLWVNQVADMAMLKNPEEGTSEIQSGLN